MGKIIEPSKDFTDGFLEFLQENYKGKEFAMATAANEYFQKRYNTTDKWTDPKNITGFVKRKTESGELFQYIGEKKSVKTGKMSKHYRVRNYEI